MGYVIHCNCYYYSSSISLILNEIQKKGCEYKFYTEFQSHEPEFDYLKSLEIEEKINKIKWCKRQNAAHFLLSTNGKYRKSWKFYQFQSKLNFSFLLQTRLSNFGKCLKNL